MNSLRILEIQNAKFSEYYIYVNKNIWRDFQICIWVPLMLKERDLCFIMKIYISYIHRFIITIVFKHQNIQKRFNYFAALIRSSPWDVFLRKGILKICSKFTVEYHCQSVISIKSLCNFIKIELRHGCSPVNLLHVLGTSLPKNTAWLLLLAIVDFYPLE